MIRSAWYFLVKHWVKLALRFSYDGINVVNKSNVPKKGPIIIVANHQNTLLDPLLLACFIPRTFHFLLRASFFGSKFGRLMANSLNMMPIYRKRDGGNISEKNDAIFNRCVNLLNKGETILIFPEGSHMGKYTLRPFQKGFARIIQAYLNQNKKVEPITVLPIGINYFNLKKATDKVVLKVGEPITVFANKEVNNPTFLNDIKKQAYTALKKQILFIEDDENYKKVENACLHVMHEPSSSPIQSLKNAQNIANNLPPHTETPTFKPKKAYGLKLLFWPLHIIPHLLAKKATKGIKDHQFKPSVYTVVSLVLHTLQYVTLLLVYICVFR